MALVSKAYFVVGTISEKRWMALYVKWKGAAECRSGHIVRDICIFGVQDLPDLFERKEFFANKFHLDFEPAALDCLESWLKFKTFCPVHLDLSFYGKLEFVKSLLKTLHRLFTHIPC